MLHPASTKQITVFPSLICDRNFDYCYLYREGRVKHLPIKPLILRLNPGANARLRHASLTPLHLNMDSNPCQIRDTAANFHPSSKTPTGRRKIPSLSHTPSDGQTGSGRLVSTIPTGESFPIQHLYHAIV